MIPVLVLPLVACVSAEQKEEKEWKVKVSQASDQRIWVSKPDGSKQCEGDSKFTPERARQELRKAGIPVFQSRKGNDGLMRTAVCGAPTGNTVDLEISRMDLPKAQTKGFKPLTQQN
jgi:hypothetical protein